MREKREGGTWMKGRGALAGALLAIPGLVVPAAAQERVAGQGPSCPGDEVVGTLGITRVACNCSYILEGSGRNRWLFRSEPVIEGVQGGGPADGRLRPGDVLVAIDGQLITTAAAGRRFARVEPGTPVELRVRRQGRERQVRVVAEAACSDDLELTVRGTEGVAVGIARPPEAPAVVSGVRGPPAAVGRAPARGAEKPGVTKRPAAVGRPPVPPAAVARPPDATAVGRQERGWLGVTLRCSECVIRRGDTGRWDEYTFREPPEIAGVTRGSPADRADLRVGDVLTHVAGLALTTPDGARAFARLRPGDVVTLRYVREGRGSTVRVEVEPEASADSLVAAAIREAYRGIVAAYGQARAAPGAPPEAEVSFSGTLGNVRIEIKGPVEVTKTDEGLVIRGGGMTVRLRETGRPGRNDR